MGGVCSQVLLAPPSPIGRRTCPTSGALERVRFRKRGYGEDRRERSTPRPRPSNQGSSSRGYRAKIGLNVNNRGRSGLQTRRAWAAAKASVDENGKQITPHHRPQLPRHHLPEVPGWYYPGNITSKGQDRSGFQVGTLTYQLMCELRRWFLPLSVAAPSSAPHIDAPGFRSDPETSDRHDW